MTTTRSFGDLQHFMGGEAVAPAPEAWLDDQYPATGERIARIPVATEAEVDRACRAAREAFPDWAAMSGTQRGRILGEASRRLRARLEELAEVEVWDTAKPIAEARDVDIHSAADALEYYAGVAPTIHGDHVDLGGAFATVRREPLGVCAGIGAWNYPLQIAAWKAAPALAAGNTMVFKPSELTPLTALMLAEVFREAGVPAGVFNVVLGDGRTGGALTSHPEVNKVSLTGSVPTGQKIMGAAAEGIKQVSLEMGGKSPLIVFPDADLDAAVSGAMLGNFYTQGEICSNGTRVFVHSSIKDAFMDKLTQRTRAMKIGDPMDGSTDVGALISAEHEQKVLSYIETAKKEGARLVTGGNKVTPDTGGALKGGWFVEPTIFDNCRDDMTHVREEIFGPVMSVLSFEADDEVLRRANETPFGLAAGLFTRDLNRAHRVSSALQAGVVWVNNFNVTPLEVPFGGYKKSGFGRENGLAALDAYTQTKTVYFEMSDVEAPY